jgi:YVTN family beta-propeller protein
VRYRARRVSVANLGLWLLVFAAALAGEAKAAQLLYVVSQDDSTVEVIDTSTDALVATLPVTKGPATIAAAPNGRKLYITHPDAGKLTVLDGASLAPRVVDVGGTPFGVAVAPDGRVFVSDWQRNVLTVLDGTTLSRIAEIPVGRSPAHVAIAPLGGRVFVTNREGDSVSVIDMKALHVIATVLVGHAPFALTVSPGGDRLYVTNVQSSDLSMLGAETLETLDTVKVGSMPYGVAVTPNSERVFITNQQSGSVSVMDAEALVVTYKTKVGRYPEGVVIEPDGSKAYVANWASGDISVLNGETGQELRRIKASSGARALAIVPAG